MNIVLVGLNHRTAPVALREQFSLADCGVRMALEDFGISGQRHRSAIPDSGQLKEAVILSTCNRLEVYAIVPDDPYAGRDNIETYLADLQGIPTQELHPHLYTMFEEEAIQHLMRVAAGLDSMVLGEPQILGQVSSAQTHAQRTGTIGPILMQLFDRAVRAGKKARSETEIGQHSTSVSHTAVRLVREELGDLSQSHALLVGAGEMAEVAARALLSEGVQQLSFINRTYARAESMAREYSGQALNWYHLPAALAMADVVVAVTGAPHVVIHESDVRPILAERAGRPLYFVDIAVPRDVEESVGDLPTVNLFDIDQLQSVVDANLSQRRAAVPKVESIVAQESTRFDDWLQSRQVLPVLLELRQKTKNIADNELRRHEHRLGQLPSDDREMVSQIVHRVVNKILHEPTVRLKTSAAEGNGLEYAHTLRDLFGLDAVPKKVSKATNGQAKNGAKPGEKIRPAQSPEQVQVHSSGQVPPGGNIE
jgi:glutamyl-tRNA reductase